MDSTTRVEELRNFCDHLVRGLKTVEDYIKREAFQEEQEWRLVSHVIGDDSGLWGFRSGRVSMVPHLTLAVAESDADVRLNAPVVGPSPDGSAALRSGRMFFNTYGLQSQFVTRSRIPFWSW